MECVIIVKWIVWAVTYRLSIKSRTFPASFQQADVTDVDECRTNLRFPTSFQHDDNNKMWDVHETDRITARVRRHGNTRTYRWLPWLRAVFVRAEECEKQRRCANKITIRSGFVANAWSWLCNRNDASGLQRRKYTRYCQVRIPRRLLRDRYPMIRRSIRLTASANRR